MVNGAKSFLLKTPSGTIWHFYLSDEQSIMYSPVEDQTLNLSSAVNLQHIKAFEATIDQEGIIHLLALTQLHQLIYCRWDGLKWQHQIVEHNRYRIHQIPYFAIAASHKHIHIIYLIKSQSWRPSETIMHYVGEKNLWSGGRVWMFVPELSTRLHDAFIDCNARLHLLFSQKKSGEYLLRYSFFNPDSLAWSKPVDIYHCRYSYPDCYLYVHQDGGMHIVWKEGNNDRHSISYISSGDSTSPADEFQPARTLYEGSAEPLHPILVYRDNLYCLWAMNDNIQYVVSMDMGNTWSEPQTFSDDKSLSPVFYTYTAFDKTDTPPSLRFWSFEYGKLPDFTNVQQTNVKINMKGDYLGNHTLNGLNAELLDTVYKNIDKLEKRVKAAERQLESIIPIVYALQDQQQQTNRSIYYMEAMIKRLNFQMEQLVNRSRLYAYSTEKRYDAKETEEQPQDVQDTNQLIKDDMIGSPPKKAEESGQQRKPFQDKQDKQDKQQDKTETPQAADSSVHEPQIRPADVSSDENDTSRIRLGNVDIIINPEDDEL